MNNELKHYGVPGMRWGRKKTKQTSSNKSNAKKSINNGKKKVGKILGIIGGTAVTAYVIAPAVAKIATKAIINSEFKKIYKDEGL